MPRIVMLLWIVAALAACESATSAQNPLPENPVPTTQPAPSQDSQTSATTPESTTTLESTPEVLRGTLTYEIVRELPHDPTSFTQGLEFVGDRLLESTGRRGESTRRWLDPETGAVQSVVALPPDLFGEGITEANGLAYQLTYTSQLVLISDLETLEQVGQVPYEGEGWGLCQLGEEFVMSNGQPSLVKRDLDTFESIETVTVTLNGDPISQLNELECVGEQVFANVWKTDFILVINPTSGVVEGVADMSRLVPPDTLNDDSAVLNGIAYRADTGTFFITGKNWPVMYELRFSSSVTGN